MRTSFVLARVRTPSSPVRERYIYKEGGRERKKEYLFLKGMTGALAPYSYLVL